MGIDALGGGVPGAWSPGGALGTGAAVVPGAGVPDDPALASEWAVDVLLGQEARLGSLGVRTASAAVRRAAERRTEAREKVEELRERIREAQRDASWWERFCGAFAAAALMLGGAATGVGLVGGLLGGGAVVAWLGGGLGIAAGSAGATSALGKLGKGEAELRAQQRSCDRLAAGQVADDAGRAVERERAVAEAIVAIEEAMRQRAMSWLALEDRGRATVSGDWLSRARVGG